MEPDREKEVYIPTISAITKSTGMVILELAIIVVTKSKMAASAILKIMKCGSSGTR